MAAAFEPVFGASGFMCNAFLLLLEPPPPGLEKGCGVLGNSKVINPELVMPFLDTKHLSSWIRVAVERPLQAITKTRNHKQYQQFRLKSGATKVSFLEVALGQIGRLFCHVELVPKLATLFLARVDRGIKKERGDVENNSARAGTHAPDMSTALC